ncbi:MAG: phosphatase PAP2 family protein [Terriglobia bacterium]|nr:phosphatase PAP2 family protein [Terriglobia bacterium]
MRALVACAGLVLVGLALHRATAGKFKPWEETGLLMALSLGWGVSVNEFALKPLFGRPGPGTLLATGRTAFHWLHGTPIDSFPSGHAVQIASVMTVLCIVYPRWRSLWYTLIAALSLALILGNWHFVSDVIAGNFVGAFGGAMIVNFWQNRQTQK